MTASPDRSYRCDACTTKGRQCRRKGMHPTWRNGALVFLCGQHLAAGMFRVAGRQG